MVKKTETVVTLIDDLDGGKADRTTRFSLDGVGYELELSRKNAAALEKALKPYVEAARRTRAPGGRRRPTGSGRGRARGDQAAVREWAQAQGLEVSERGRIAKAVTDAYDAAH